MVESFFIADPLHPFATILNFSCSKWISNEAWELRSLNKHLIDLDLESEDSLMRIVNLGFDVATGDGGFSSITIIRDFKEVSLDWKFRRWIRTSVGSCLFIASVELNSRSVWNCVRIKNFKSFDITQDALKDEKFENPWRVFFSKTNSPHLNIIQPSNLKITLLWLHKTWQKFDLLSKLGVRLNFKTNFKW